MFSGRKRSEIYKHIIEAEMEIHREKEKRKRGKEQRNPTRTVVLNEQKWYNQITKYDSVEADREVDLMDKYDHNQHSVYLLYYHLIMVVKNRRKVIDEEISEYGREIFEYIGERYGITLEEWNHDEDHVHVMFRAKPQTEISKFINAYKSASSRLIKKEHPQIKEKLWKEAFWSQSYCLLTAGGAPIEVIRQYIETQGEKR